MSQVKSNVALGLISLFIMLELSGRVGARKELKCQGDECQMKPDHFRLYSTVKRAVDRNFNVKCKDLVSVIRSVEILERRFEWPNQRQDNRKPTGGQQPLNGTELVLRLLASDKLREAMKVFNSDEGIQLVSLYKSSINGNQQNLACSKWRVAEIEAAARKLEQNERLAKVFANVHKNFVERSARKCLKSSCSSIDDNMNRLDSVVRRASRRKGFLAHDEPTFLFEPSSTSAAAATPASIGQSSPARTEETNAIDEALIAQLDNEPASEFHLEELELCKFFKRTNSSQCQASGSELNELSFAPQNATTATTTAAGPAQNLAAHLAAFQENRSRRGEETPTEQVLRQCGAIKPTLDYHLFGLRWFQRQNLISAERVRTRTFWCPSLTYWFEIDRLCDELKRALSPGESFAY